jgi:hypothetical protein
VQSAFAKFVLTQQFKDIGVLSEKDSIDDHEDFMSVFRNRKLDCARSLVRFTNFLLSMLRSVWADHADYISKAYSGTGALKTDFTRTGVRTKQGLLMDGQNSIVRYIKNNYFDGDRQVTAIVSELRI